MKINNFILLVPLLLVNMALASDEELRLQEKRVSERKQELKDAQDAANPAKEMRKQMRLDEETTELERLKDENSK